jgi:hypothetical protein
MNIGGRLALGFAAVSVVLAAAVGITPCSRWRHGFNSRRGRQFNQIVRAECIWLCPINVHYAALKRP